MRKLALTAVAACLLLAAPAWAQTVQLAPYGGQNFSQPFYVAGAPGDPSRVFVVEAAGTIRLVKNGVTQPAAFLDVSADVLDINEGGCECGLFSMALSPDYASSGLFYVYYTRDVNPGQHNLVIEEVRRSAGNPDVADPASRRLLLEIAHPSAGNHNGGQLQFGPDKLLYIATGDGGGGQSANAQNPASLLGKILRIDPSGAVQLEIYSTGLRNPYRFSFDRSTGDLTIGDVGEGAWEEIDFKAEGLGRGANFGWNCFEGPAVSSGCSVPNHSPPVFSYGHSGAAAINGGYVIRDSALPSLAGRYIYGDSSGTLGTTIHTISLFADGSSGDAALPGVSASGVVSFGQDACGHVYVASIDGPVYRLEPTSGGFPCKTAPVLKVDDREASQAANKGGLVLGVSCDEDCDVAASATIELGGAKKKGRGQAARKKRRKKPKLTPTAAGARLQLGVTTTLKLALSKRDAKRLRRALAQGKRAVARIQVSATGGGGGTDTKSLTVKQGLKKKKKRKHA